MTIDDRNGAVVTFYSYNGGTGRTMALANISWILAANGRRVLVMDWNFESPGLHRYFRPFIRSEDFERTAGVIDIIRGYEWAFARGGAEHERYARVQPHAVALDWDFPGEGCLHLLPAGRQDRNYAGAPSAADWDEFYERLDGGRFLDALRRDMRRGYDYTLIDSRTGLDDVADICTIHLPDVLVDCFTLSAQGIEGAADAAAAVRYRDADRDIRILPVAMRVDTAEQEKAEIGRTVAMRRLAGLPDRMTDAEREAYWNAVEVPYRPFYAFEEILATFGDRPGAVPSLLRAYEALTRYVTGGAVTRLPSMDDGLRLRTLARFTRRAVTAEEEVALRYAPEDQVWAEWIERLLVSVGVRVHDARDGAGRPGAGPEPPPDARSLTVVSAASAAAYAHVVPRDRDGARGALAVYVQDLRPLPGFAMSASAFVAGVSADVAIERILRLVGRAPAASDIDQTKLGVRFPGAEPLVFDAPVRGTRFTGREDVLRRLRTHLSAHGGGAVPPGPVPVVLHGMGGAGKTQVALEYVHRFKNAYDVVRWVDAGHREPGAELADRPAPGTPYARWLIVLDGAEDVRHVSHLLPHGDGHLLVTSRGNAWQDLVHTIRIDVFTRRESVQLLRARVPAITVEDAARLAELLGDLPAAVAAAGAWLADTGAPVADYLRQVERHGLVDVEQAWEPSLARLRQQSPTGYRLLELCSVLAPVISLDIVYSDALAAALAPFDPAVSERPYRGLLVQQINRLALLRLDVGARQIHVHRLLQHLVRIRLTEAELGETRHRAHRILAALRPAAEVDDPVSWQAFAVLWPHLDGCGAMRCRDEAVRELMIDRLRYVCASGDLGQGHSLALRIEAAWREMLDGPATGADRAALRRQLLALRGVLGGILRALGRFDAALGLDGAVLLEQRELLGPDHPHTRTTAVSLAADLRALGRYAAALRQDRDTYAACTASLGATDPVTLAARSSLATSHRLAGDFRAAAEHDSHVYAARRELFGADHPYTLESGGNLGRDLRESGDYEGSVALLRTVRRRVEEAFGAAAGRTLAAAANLAASLRAAGRADLAAPFLEDAYERLNDSLGPANPDTLACRHSRAVNLLATGQVDSAAAELAELQLAYEGALGVRHPYALACVNNRAVVSRAAGDIPLARSLAGEAARGMAEALGAGHPHTFAARLNLAILHAEDGDLATALRIAEEGAEGVARALGPEHPDAVRWEVNLTLMVGDGDRASGAADRLAAMLGPRHPTVAAARRHSYLHRTVDPG